MPSLHHRIATLERAATPALLPTDIPIETFGEFLQVNERVLAHSKRSGRFVAPEEEALAKSDHCRLIDAYKSGRVLMLAPLSEMFNHAVEDEHLDRNPCLRILRTTREEKGQQQQKIDFLTREELSLLLTTCKEHFSAAYPFVLLLARTGLRIGEAVALQWGDLDFQSRFIAVQRNWVDGYLTTPKSGKGRRVDMSLQLAETLGTLLLERKKETLKKGWREVPEWVFTSEVGTMMDPDNFRSRVWSKLLTKAGVRHLRIHDLRHTFASLLIQQGESLAYVKEQMGHHSIRATVDVYGHLVPGGNKAAVDRLDDANAVPSATIRNLSATSKAVVESEAC